MTKQTAKLRNQGLRQRRVRAIVQGTAVRPRLSVHVSNQHVSAQLIDDTANTTIAYATTVGKKASGTLTDKAGTIGSEIATKAKAAKISSVVFDRGAKLYHGRVKALADAARKEGLEF